MAPLSAWRITASDTGAVCAKSIVKLSQSLLKKLCTPRTARLARKLQTRGAVATQNVDFCCSASGLHISPEFPFLATTSDGGHRLCLLWWWCAGGEVPLFGYGLLHRATFTEKHNMSHPCSWRCKTFKESFSPCIETHQARCAFRFLLGGLLEAAFALRHHDFAPVRFTYRHIYNDKRYTYNDK